MERNPSASFKRDSGSKSSPMETPPSVSRGTQQGPCFTARSTTTSTPYRLRKNITARAGHLSQPVPSNQLLDVQ